MFRTRDFLLIFSVVAFLVFAIGGTLIMRVIEHRAAPTQTIPELVSVSEEPTFTATVSATDTVARDERLADMRRQIAARSELISAPKPAAPVLDDLVSSTSDTALKTNATPKLCVGYTDYYGKWDATRTSLEFAEGAWLVAQTDPLSGTVQVVMTLPSRSFKSGEYCVPHDVIGVAQDGSLIRNNEVELYSVFGASTIVGYALDGFPIYGQSTVATDSCGGAAVAGQYGYYINTSRASIINCFAAPPTLLP
ncbi:hypothetical protein KC887_01620 [Candidatus Kaiserbacteria bacterium]|nr:hypothetical protein [Candidatus Kaiserbacteria bacterium]